MHERGAEMRLVFFMCQVKSAQYPMLLLHTSCNSGRAHPPYVGLRGRAHPQPIEVPCRNRIARF